jgi:hypothetical protein
MQFEGWGGTRTDSGTLVICDGDGGGGGCVDGGSAFMGDGGTTV